MNIRDRSFAGLAKIGEGGGASAQAGNPRGGTLVDANAVSKSADGWVPIGLDGTPMRRRYISSIGGDGVFDGIFLTSIIAPILAEL